MKNFNKLLSLIMLSLFLSIGINSAFATTVTVTLVDENGVALANYPPSTSEMSYKYRCGGSWVGGGNVQTDALGQFVTSDITCSNWDGKITLNLHQRSKEEVVSGGAVTFQTARVNVNLKNECTGLVTATDGTVKQGGGHWYTHGSTAGTGVVTFYTFPGGSVKVQMNYHWASRTQYPVIVAGTNEVDFLTTTVDYTYDGVVKHQSGSWNVMTFPFELLQGNHNIKFGSTLKTIAISGCAITQNIHIFKTKKADGSALPNINISRNDYGNHYVVIGTTDANGDLFATDQPTGTWNFKAYKDHTQQIKSSTPSSITFQTAKFMVHAKMSDCSTDFPGIAASFNDYGNHYLSMGNTDANGLASIELFPGNYKFRAYKDHTDKTGMLELATSGTTGEVVLQTSEYIVHVKKSDGSDFAGIAASFNDYGNHFLSMGNTDANGKAAIELFPGNRKFRAYKNHTANTAFLDIPTSCTSTIIVFQTALITSVAKDCETDNPIEGIAMSFNDYGNHYLSMGNTDANGMASIELFPGTAYKFRGYTIHTSATQTVDLPTAGLTVEFNPTRVSLQYAGTVKFNDYGNHWLTIPLNTYMFPGTYNFNFYSSSQPTQTAAQTVSACSITKSIVFIKLEDSNGDGLEGGIAKYNKGGWQTAGTTGPNGYVLALIDGLQNTLDFRMYWEGSYIHKYQNISTNSLVVFQTELVTLDLLSSTSAPLVGEGKVNSGGWKSLGNTPGASMELLPKTYDFRIYYNGSYIHKYQNVTTNQLVQFQTKEVSMSLLDSYGTTELVGVGKVNSGGWKTIGNTPGATMELLPKTYDFRIYYEGSYIHKYQNVSSTPKVQFQTKLVSMSLLASNGTTELDGIGKVNSGGWKVIGNTPGATMELLPKTYDFRIYYEGSYIHKYQNVSSTPKVQFQTKLVSMSLTSSIGASLVGVGKVNSGGWKTMGDTPGASLELLPKTYDFRIYYDGSYIHKYQDVSSTPNVQFQTVLVTTELVDGSSNPIIGGEGKVNSGGWISLGFTPFATRELLPKTYDFRMYHLGSYTHKYQNVAGNQTVTFTYDGGFKNGEITSDYITMLNKAYPNPFTTMTTIDFATDKEQKVVVAVYDINGKLVKTLINENLSEGNHSVSWNSQNEYGGNVKQGVYFVKLITANSASQKTIVKMR